MKLTLILISLLATTSAFAGSLPTVGASPDRGWRRRQHT